MIFHHQSVDRGRVDSEEHLHSFSEQTLCQLSSSQQTTSHETPTLKSCNGTLVHCVQLVLLPAFNPVAISV
jgi:hypothetical protein